MRCDSLLRVAEVLRMRRRWVWDNGVDIDQHAGADRRRGSPAVKELGGLPRSGLKFQERRRFIREARVPVKRLQQGEASIRWAGGGKVFEGVVVRIHRHTHCVYGTTPF